jgi:hypothetical protein
MARWPATGGGPGQLTSGTDSGRAARAELTGGARGAVVNGHRLGRSGG